MKTVTVINRSGGFVYYDLPELNIKRAFAPKEVKKVSSDELVQLGMKEGGQKLLHDYLFIDDADVRLEATNIQEEVEYFLKEEQIPGWMNNCSLDEFKDALDFAPKGVIELIKDFAISMPLNDVAKREALKTQLKFDVAKAIEINVEDKGTAPAPTEATGRRATKVAAETPTRRIIKTTN